MQSAPTHGFPHAAPQPHRQTAPCGIAAQKLPSLSVWMTVYPRSKTPCPLLLERVAPSRGRVWRGPVEITAWVRFALKTKVACACVAYGLRYTIQRGLGGRFLGVPSTSARCGGHLLQAGEGFLGASIRGCTCNEQLNMAVIHRKGSNLLPKSRRD